MAVYEIEFTVDNDKRSKRAEAASILGMSGYNPSGWTPLKSTFGHENYLYDSGRDIGIDLPTIRSLQRLCGARIIFVKR